MKYHVFKSSRMYVGQPYSGPTNNGIPAESDDLEEAMDIADRLYDANPIGWDVYDSDTKSIVYNTYDLEHLLWGSGCESNDNE